MIAAVYHACAKIAALVLVIFLAVVLYKIMRSLM